MSGRHLRSHQPTLTQLSENSTSLGLSQTNYNHDMAETTAPQPPTFSGYAKEDPDTFLKAFLKYAKFRDIIDVNKRLNLFAVLLKNCAADWFDALPDNSKDTFEHAIDSFKQRYQPPEVVKFRCANDLFIKKQMPDETVDDYVTRMRKLARTLEVDDNILKFALINGLKPVLAAPVIQAKVETIDGILETARLAELSTSRVDTSVSDAIVPQQLADIQTELRRLSTKIDHAATNTIASRSPTPERRVRFVPSESPRRRATSISQADSQRAQSSRFKGVYNKQQSQVRQPSRPSSLQQRIGVNNTCPRCARFHGQNAFCPARDPSKVCNFCHKPGHFQAACFSAQNQF